MPSLQPLSLSLSRAAAAAARGGPREGGLAGPPRRDLGPADLSVGPPPGPPPGPSLGGPPRQGSGPTGERREPPPAGEGGKRGSGPRPPGLPGDSLGQPRGRGGDPSIFPHIPPVLSRYQPGLRARGGWPRRSRSLGSASVSLAGPRGEGGRAGPRGGIRHPRISPHLPPGPVVPPPGRGQRSGRHAELRFSLRSFLRSFLRSVRLMSGSGFRVGTDHRPGPGSGFEDAKGGGLSHPGRLPSTQTSHISFLRTSGPGAPGVRLFEGSVIPPPPVRLFRSFRSVISEFRGNSGMSEAGCLLLLDVLVLVLVFFRLPSSQVTR